jgi:hypothetical protein
MFIPKRWTLEAIKNQTHDFAASYYTPTISPPFSEKGTILLKAWQNLETVIGSHCEMRRAVMEAASLALCEELHIRGEDNGRVALYDGTMLVPLASDNGHNYKLGEPVLIVRQDNAICLRMDGSTGNSICSHRSSLRPATDEEIEIFFKSRSNDSGDNQPLFDSYPTKSQNGDAESFDDEDTDENIDEDEESEQEEVAQ